MAFIQTIYAYIVLTLSLIRAFINLLYGIWQLNKLQHTPITIFAGNYLDQNSKYITIANNLSQNLVKNNIPILTSGCPGIMHIKNCPKTCKKCSKMGSVIISQFNNRTKKLENKHLIIYKLFARKWLLIGYSKAFIVFPGGLGTMSELTQLLTLIQTKMRSKAPIILYDMQYWVPFIKWLEDSALKEGLVSLEETKLFITSDDIEGIYRAVVDI